MSAAAPREPLPVQYLRALLPSLPPPVLTTPGARQLRVAVQTAAASRGWPFTPTRRELAEAVRALHADGTLAVPAPEEAPHG